MKKLLLVMSFIMLVQFLPADLNFYGNARIGVWYVQEDKDWTGGEERLSLQYNLHTNSRFGADYSSDRFNANVEFGFKWGDAYLRKIYGEYKFEKLALLVGQDYTGFSDLAAQVASFPAGLDNSLIAYGSYYDGRKPQVKVTFVKGPYIIFMEPVKIAPVASANDMDVLLPKVNIGYKFNVDNVTFHTTFGLNVSQYNKEFASIEVPNPDYDPADSTSMEYIDLALDDTVIAYGMAATISYKSGAYSIMGQVNYGQNIVDYGINSAVYGKAGWDAEKNEIINTFTFGGFGQFCYKLNDKSTISLGAGYLASENDLMDDQDTAMSIFAQMSYKLSDKIFMVPEIGIVDEMEDGFGIKEGSRAYVGTKFQVNIP